MIINVEGKEERTIEGNVDNIEINAGKDSKIIILDISKSKDKKVNVKVGENAKVEYRFIQNFDKNVESQSERIGEVGKNGKLDWVDCFIGGKISNDKIETRLKGEGAESNSYAIIFGDGEQRFNIDNKSIHEKSKTFSNIMTKVVLNGEARVNFNGLVKINENAKGCEGYQKADTILLSDDAKARVVPNLEINNNEVKCSHGATVSQIDDDNLFYMMSRGINAKDAKKTIVEGFFDPVLIKMNNEKIKEEVKIEISERLELI